MAQNNEQRKASIATARKANHQKNLETKKRLDAYVDIETKEGLKVLKKHFDVSNEGLAIDQAVKMALSMIDKD